MADADFFFDTLCPWAWITSRWVQEVVAQRQLDVDWRFIALRFVNAEKVESGQLPERYAQGLDFGLGLLRIAAAAKDKEGSEAAGRFYTAAGTAIHVDGRRDQLVSDPATHLAEVLRAADLPTDLVDARQDDSYDAVIRSDTDLALERAGKDVGTPIITFAPPGGPSFFGPVIARIPRGQEALELWDSVERLARFPGFFELKSAVRSRPQTS
ncbi:MAG TPA: hypothetical protein VE990_15190 [Acidimicrobiales bacterium]|nr:hypothetical protein [Acidimicrobiales bacterium]